MKRDLIRTGAASLIIKVTSAILAFGVSVLLARMLGPEGYGVYAFALAVITILSLPAHMGLPQLIVRETARAHSKNDWPAILGVWKWATKVSVVISLFIVLVVFLVFLISQKSIRMEALLIGSMLIPTIALSNIRSASLRGLRHIVLGQLPESLFKPGAMIVILILVLALPGSSISPQESIFAYFISSFVSFLIGAIFLLVAQGTSRKEFKPRIESPKNLYASIFPLAMVAGLQLINNQADILVMGIFRTDSEVGVYRAVFQTALLVVFGLQALNQVLQPHFARLHSLGETKKLERLVRYSTRAITLLAIPPVLLFVFFGGPILEHIFGAPYRSGAIALAVLAAGQGVKALMGTSISLLIMSGNEKITARLGLLAVVVNLVLNVILVPIWGGSGAAVATFVSIVFWRSASTYWIKNYLLKDI